MVSSVHLEICQESWDWHECYFSSAADGLTQWSHRATVLVVQQHLPPASVFSHNNPLTQLTECGRTISQLQAWTQPQGSGAGRARF